jgi:hypothetical protein
MTASISRDSGASTKDRTAFYYASLILPGTSDQPFKPGLAATCTAFLGPGKLDQASDYWQASTAMPLFAYLSGLFVTAAAVLDWDWFFHDYRAKFLVDLFGQTF